MAEMDMGISPGTKKRKKKKKQSLWNAIVTGLFPVKGDSATEAVRKMVFLTGLLVLAVAASLIIVRAVQYAGLRNRASGEQGGVADEYIVRLKNLTPTPTAVEKLPQGAVNEKFAELYAENSDFVGWINIPGMDIDYPVVQTTDNEYYLRKNFRKKYDFAGTLFADYEGVISADGMPQNTIIYGHNMGYKYQFTMLMNYKRRIEYLRGAPVIHFDTLYGENTYKIFSVFETNISKEHGEVFNYTERVYFRNRDEFYDFVLECGDRSIYETGVDVEYGDEFLTLSTCDEDIRGVDMRLVVVARKVRPDESPEVDESAIVKKDSVKYFDAYYRIFGDLWHGRQWDTSLVKGLDEYIEQKEQALR